jgi:hypothetical protein
MKLLYRTSEAKAALGVGTTKLYEVINNGTLDAAASAGGPTSRVPRLRRSSGRSSRS